MGVDDSLSNLPDSNYGWNVKRSRELRSGRFDDIKAVVIGGGTGAPVSIKTLLAMGAQTSAVVAMTDDGGSTGLLREHADTIPPGDIRKCITAMAGDPVDPLVRAFKYRFDYAYNHTLGNLLITALADVASFTEAIDICERILNCVGHVYPSTLDPVILEGKTRDGRLLRGQSTIAHSETALDRVWLNPSHASAYEPALEAIRAADLIVLGPGSLFTSIIPNLLVPGITDAIRESGAATVFLCSVADMQGETWGLDCSEHVDAVLDHGMEGLLHAACVQGTRNSSDPNTTSELIAIGQLEVGTVKSREFETLTTSGEERSPATRRAASKAIRSVPFDREIEARIKSRVPVLLERKLVDPVYPTWHSPRALGEVFKGVLEICRSQAR
ncbi:MAG: gluconeogenesis factor YvcK family protein [Coriobacteriales bacterium]|jgi:uncharacterized cofD-like protein